MLRWRAGISLRELLWQQGVASTFIQLNYFFRLSTKRGSIQNSRVMNSAAGPKRELKKTQMRTKKQRASSSMSLAARIVPAGIISLAKYAYRDLPLQPETKKVFDQATTGPLQAGPHRYSLDHAAYNDAVKHSLMQFMRDNGIIAETMTPDLAQRFLDSVKRSSDPRIRDFNLKIFRREVNHAIRRLGRRPD